MNTTDEELIARAVRAHETACKHEGAIPDQPSNADSGVEEINGDRYVVLRNGRGILRIYKVRGDERLMQVAELPGEGGR